MKNYILIQETSFEKARRKIRENKDKKIIFTSDDDDLNRKILEKEKINILLINKKNRKDFSKQRDSGFNQVLAKIAKKNNVEIGINLDEIIESTPQAYSDKSSKKISTRGKDKADILGRIRQNIKLCNKNKLNMKFIAQKKENQRSVYELKALGLVLGMPTWMTSSLDSD